jgi:tRNA(fMet)-specific endonuclease VapC
MILDTNALSDFAEGNPRLIAILLLQPDWRLNVVTLGEYRFGLKSSRAKEAREHWLQALEEVQEVLEITPATTHAYAEIRHFLKKSGKPIPENDLWIAALARQHDLPLVSRDTHFDRVAGLKRISW